MTILAGVLKFMPIAATRRSTAQNRNKDHPRPALPRRRPTQTLFNGLARLHPRVHALMASRFATARLCVPSLCLAYLYMRLSAPSPVPESISSKRFSYGEEPGNLPHDLLHDDVALRGSALAVLRSLRLRELRGLEVLHDARGGHGF